MAKIDAIAQVSGNNFIIALGASLSIMLCMVVSVLGIKIWWFKHRLTFDHSETNNGAAGGSAPAVVPRQRRSRDKRVNERYRTSVDVHGVFRKRQDDEINIIPPTQLPPIHMTKISQSTPSLLLPPRRLDEPLQTSGFEWSQPPSREPPMPPIFTTQVTTTNLQNSPKEVPDFATVETENTVSLVPDPVKETVNQNIEIKLASPPQPPKRYQRNMSTDSTRGKNAPMMEMKPVDYGLNLSAEDIKKLEYVKEPTPADAPFPYANGTEEHTVTTTGFIYTSTTIEEVEVNANNGTNQNSWLSINLPDDSVGYIYEEPVTPQKQINEDPFKRHGSVEIVEVTEEPAESLNVEEVQPILVPPPRKVKFRMAENNDNFNESEEQLSDEDKSTLNQLRRPTSFERNSELVWQELEKDNTTSEEPLWFDMPSHINENFANNIEEEFNKIRQSYQENEASFLEPKEDANENQNVSLTPVQPHGFGKSIEEDWENFIQLEKAKLNLSAIKTNEIQYEEVKIMRDNDYKEIQRVSFKLPVYEEQVAEEGTSNFFEESRPSRYVENATELFEDTNNATYNFYDYKKNSKYESTEYERNRRENSPVEKRISGENKNIGFFAVKHKDDCDDDPYTREAHKDNNVYDTDFLSAKERKQMSYKRNVEDIYGSANEKDNFGYDPHSRSELEESNFSNEKSYSNKEQKPLIYKRTLGKYYEIEHSGEEDYLDYDAKPYYNMGATHLFTKENALPKEPEKTTYEKSVQELYERLDKTNYEDFTAKPSVRFNVDEEVDDEYKSVNSHIKERRPTGFAYRSSVHNVENEPEDVTSSPEPEIPKGKTRQKVTFDFNTSEHRYPAGYRYSFDSESDEEENEVRTYDRYDEEKEEGDIYNGESSPSPQLPKPMQRLNKIRYTEESFEPITTPPILFSTQVSLDSTSTDDSWSAIRQHRHLTEELQQMSIQPTLREPPRAAYRNPLAQMALRLEDEQQLNEVARQQTRSLDEGYFSSRTTEA